MNYLFPLIAAIIWGGNTVVTKLCAASLSPVDISFYRWTLAVIVLTPFSFNGVLHNAALSGRVLAKLVALGLLGGVVYQSIAYYAAHFTSATNMGVIQTLIPLVSLVLAMTFLRHKTSATAIGGLAVSIIGVIIVVSKGRPDVLLQQGLNTGDALMLAGVLSFALYSVLLNKWRLPVPLVQSAYIQAIVAAIAFLPAYVAGDSHRLTTIDGFYISFAGIGASILAPLLWMTGVARLGSARVSLFFNFVPVVTAVLAHFFLAESLSRPVLCGSALAIFGVVIAEVRKRKPGEVAR